MFVGNGTLQYPAYTVMRAILAGSELRVELKAGRNEANPPISEFSARQQRPTISRMDRCPTTCASTVGDGAELFTTQRADTASKDHSSGEYKKEGASR